MIRRWQETLCAATLGVALLLVAIPEADAQSAQISLRLFPSSAYVGETVSFSGHLMAGGQPIPNAAIQIKKSNTNLPDETLVTARTGQQGQYSATWIADPSTNETEFGVFAVFRGTQHHPHAVTSIQQLGVLKHTGSITLDPIPLSVHAGDPVRFSGTLSLYGTDTTNTIVYIMGKNNDTHDSLLATAYVNSDGSYAVTWTPRAADTGNIIAIYAVFEGLHTHYRLTTCDDGPTHESGGLCLDTRALFVLEPRPYVQPGPANTEYVALDYVVPFTSTPTVAFAPSPYAYDQTYRYVAPAMEGLQRLTSELSALYGGNWDLNYETIGRNAWQANSRADVVVNMITVAQDSTCDSRGGWAPGGLTERPIQIHVCTSASYGEFDPADVMRIATHEFIHAIGVGHAFNIPSDMMCSIESDTETCPGSYVDRDPRPSTLTLEAIAVLYGSDGYLVPNSTSEPNIPGYLTPDGYLYPSATPVITYSPASTESLVVLETTAGYITIELFDRVAPRHAENMRRLADSGFYDGTRFHRIIPGFMVQGGDPNTKGGDRSTWGTGWPGYSINAEFNDISHVRGIVSMARADDPDSAGSQFFIMHDDGMYLDGEYTVFGRLAFAYSYDTLDALASLRTDSNDAPVRPDEATILKAYVARHPHTKVAQEHANPERADPERADPEPQDPEPSQVATTDRTFNNKGIGVSLEYPRGWDVRYSMDSDDQPRVLLTGPETDSPFPPYISVTLVDYDGSLHHYAHEADRFSGYQQYKTFLRPTMSWVDDHDALRSVYSIRESEGSYTMWVTKIDVKVDDDIYTIRYMADPDDYEAYIDDFYDVRESIRLHGSPW